MRLHARPMHDDDEAVVLDLIDADRLPCQPQCTPEMLAEARAGRSPVDTGSWDELADLHVDVAEMEGGGVVGVVSHGRRPRDGAGMVLWLHGREDSDVVGFLLDHALGAVGGSGTVHAFPFATALGMGLEALPVRHREVTHRVFVHRGFEGGALWRYLCRRLPAPALLPRGARIRVSPVEDGRRRLTLQHDSAVIGEATIGVPVAGVGVVWWVEVDPSRRGTGVGRTLFGSALDLLARSGAREVVLYVADGESIPEGDRAAARVLYESAGFEEVDRLVSLHRKV
jgi:GNAT superfamily N-acetyltransferase